MIKTVNHEGDFLAAHCDVEGGLHICALHTGIGDQNIGEEG
jgi:hypothetical protein